MDENKYRRPRKSNKLNLRITDDELNAITTMSFEEDIPVSQVVRKAIKVYDALRKNKFTCFGDTMYGENE